jgi:hypothetical protein
MTLDQAKTLGLLCLALLTGIFGFWSATQRGNARLNEALLAAEQHYTASLAAAQAKAKEYQNEADEARKAYDVASRDLDAALVAGNRLRDANADLTRRLSAVSVAARERFATACADVFGQCANEYQAMAATAQRCAVGSWANYSAWTGALKK